MTERTGAIIRPASDPAAIDAAVVILRAGGLVGMPTETVYGLAADASSSAAVAGIYAAKGRPRFNPLIAHVSDLAAAERLVSFDPLSRKLAEAFWPGPLTLVLPKRADAAISDLVTAGLETLAVRIPAHPAAQALLQAFGGALAAPSANRSGHVSATTARHVAADLGAAIGLVLDAGASPVGVESTILMVRGDEIVLLRAGGITREAIEQVAGRTVAIAQLDDPEAPVAPGQLQSHYAPVAQVRLDVRRVLPGEALIAFGPELPEGAELAAAVINLSPRGDLVEAASNLFAALRDIDGTSAAIAVSPIPSSGIGEAIVDRLRRAAAPRP